jgi:hypothetical protein
MPPAQTQGPRNASPRTQRKRPGDLTGVRGQQLATQAAIEKAEQSAQLAEGLEEQRVAKLATEVDYSSDARERERLAAASDPVAEVEVEVRPKTRRIRVNYPIEEMTFGKEIITDAKYDENGVMTAAPVLGGLKTYTFEEGRWYTVDTDLAEHLAFLGYIYE